MDKLINIAILLAAMAGASVTMDGNSLLTMATVGFLLGVSDAGETQSLLPWLQDNNQPAMTGG